MKDTKPLVILTDEISMSELRYLMEHVQHEGFANLLESAAIQTERGERVQIILTVKG